MAANKPIEIKPTTFERGVPKEEHNGFFGEGTADRLLDLPLDTQITAIVTYRLSDDVTRMGKHTRYPVLAVDHIEPLWDAEHIADAIALQADAYTDRTGKDQLDFSGVENQDGEQ